MVFFEFLLFCFYVYEVGQLRFERLFVCLSEHLHQSGREGMGHSLEERIWSDEVERLRFERLCLSEANIFIDRRVLGFSLEERLWSGLKLNGSG